MLKFLRALQGNRKKEREREREERIRYKVQSIFFHKYTKVKSKEKINQSCKKMGALH